MARPRGFDPDAAVATAMTLFWQNGYDAVSLDDLVRETGASRKGLYALWPDKRALLVSALQKYREVVGDHFLHDLERTDTGLADIAQFWKRFESAARTPGWKGCLVVRTASSSIADEADVAREIKLYLDRLGAAFDNALRRAAARGDLTKEISPLIAASQAFAAAVACSTIGIFEGFTPRVAGLIKAGRASCGLAT